MRVCSVLDRLKLPVWFYPNATRGEEKLQVCEGLTQLAHDVQNETGATSALSDHCGEITFLLNCKEHRYRELPTVHKSAHSSITAQGNHWKNPGYAVRQAIQVRTMRFAILPVVIHRKSQFVPSGNDVLTQVAPFRCTFSVPNDAVQAFLAFVPCLKPRTVSVVEQTQASVPETMTPLSISPSESPSSYNRDADLPIGSGHADVVRLLRELDLHHGYPGGISRDPFRRAVHQAYAAWEISSG